ncbi:YfhO family protein [Nocardioides sp. P5_E3]
MRLRTWAGRLRPTWQQSGVLGVFGLVLLTMAWPTLTGRTSSVVPSFQTATFPWAARPRGLAYTWPQSDQAESAFPWSVLARRTWRSGDLPLWDPLSFGGGVPWATDGVAATLYPGRAIPGALFMPWLAHDVFIFVHLALAGAGAYWLARRWGAGYVGATVAGVGWMTNAYVWSWAPLEMVTPFFAALPLALAAADRAVRSPSRSAVALAAGVLALGMVAGNITYSVILAATCSFYVVGVLLARLVASRSDWRALGRSAAAGAGLLVLGLALSAVVLAPTLVNLFRVSRQPFTFETLTAALMVPWDAYTRILERPDTPPTAEQLLVMLHITPVVVVLAVAGLVLARGPGGWSARAIVAVPVLIASSVPGAWMAYHLFPGFDVIRPYGRLLPLALLGTYVLAGLGADRLWELLTGRLRRGVPVWVAPAAAVVLLAGIFVPAHAVSRSLVPPEIEVKDHPQFPRTPLIREIKEEDSETGWPLRVLPTVPTFDTDPPTAGALILIGGTALVPGLDTWGGYASAVPGPTSDLLRLVGGEDDAAVLGDAPAPDIAHPVFTSGTIDWALACRLGTDLLALPPTPPEIEVDWGGLDRGALDEVYSGPDGQVLRMPDACTAAPRLTANAVVAGSDGEAVDLLRSQGQGALESSEANEAASVVLSRDADTDTPMAGSTGEVRSASRDGNTARVDVNTDGPMWLVLPIAFDEGWSVSVDGEPVEVEQVDYNRLGVLLESGDHRVVASFAPSGWTAGRLVSLGALLVLIALLLPVRRRSRDPEGKSVVT